MGRRDQVGRAILKRTRARRRAAAAVDTISIIPVPGIPEIGKKAVLAAEIVSALRANRIALRDGDILVIAQKIVSKSEGRSVRIAMVKISARAARLAKRLGKDPRKVELILRESSEIVASGWPKGKPEGVLITRHRSGHVCCNSGIDESNVGEGVALLLPIDPDASARKIRKGIASRLRRRIGVIVSDTFGRPWRNGLVNVAIGASGLAAIVDLRGTRDASGRVLKATVVALADELAAAAGLAMAKDSGIPVVILRGVRNALSGEERSAREIIRPSADDVVGGRI